jgi:hypothetical protein
MNSSNIDSSISTDLNSLILSLSNGVDLHFPLAIPSPPVMLPSSSVSTVGIVAADSGADEDAIVELIDDS